MFFQVATYIHYVFLKEVLRMFEAMGFFGVGKPMGQAIVNAVDSVGYGIIAASTIAAIISAGGLSVAAAAVDVAILTIKEYIKKDMKAAAVVW
ncbi:uberolysin/carnocyclin family circular bacteriocin [Bacillus cereus]|uniref:uberolysin/carnocyclin family circular bacteriocin n=2 Tax=Bacillus cereus TaxID=1396 RepID=UPI003012D304